jgi:hypothetical protein
MEEKATDFCHRIAGKSVLAAANVIFFIPLVFFYLQYCRWCEETVY